MTNKNSRKAKTAKNDEFFVLKDYPAYTISRNGEVYSTISSKILKNVKLKIGYLRVTLSGRKQCFIHRLLAITFIPNPDNKPHVHHKDGNTVNNNIDNLEWVTHKENIQFSCKGNKSYLYKNKDYYATKSTTRVDFRLICKRQNWNFNNFKEIDSGIKYHTSRKFYYKELI